MDEHRRDTERLDAALWNSRRLRRDARHICEQARRDLALCNEKLSDLQVLAETLASFARKASRRR